MSERIVVIQGHPDAQRAHFAHALAAAYAEGALEAGHDVRRIEVTTLEFPLLRSKQEFDTEDPPASIRDAQETIAWASHVVILFPLWLGSMPALLKGFLEQTFRPGFAIPRGAPSMRGRKLLAGRSARVIVTMGMPAFFYRWYFGAHSVKSLKRNILSFCGFKPVRESLIGLVEAKEGSGREKWLRRVRDLGRDAA